MLTIQELARVTGVSAHTLRYYEREGLVPDVERRANGHRRYADEHVFWVTFLRRLRAAGMSISEIREYAGLVRRGDATLPERIELLERHREALESRIRELRESLDLLDIKLEFYAERREGACAEDFLAYLERRGRSADGGPVRREGAA